MSVLYFALSLALTISLLVVVHEYGHFIVARMCGIKVLRFSVGWGKVLWTRKAGPDQTEYALSALPIGGYVKMLDDREGNVPAADAHRTFTAQPVWQRIAVLFAGPAFNFIFAIAAYWLIFVLGAAATRPVVGVVTPGSPADIAGLQRNDVIVDIGGRHIDSWQDGIQVLVDELVGDGEIPMMIERGTADPFPVVVRVDDETARLAKPGKLFDGIGMRPWTPNSRVGVVSEGSAGAAAGLIPGDEIVAIDQVLTPTWSDVVDQIRVKDAPRQREFEVLRDGQSLFLAVTPDVVTDKAGSRPQVGLLPGDTQPVNLYGIKKLTAGAAIPEAVATTWDKIGFTLEMFGRMLTGSVSAKNISGPINIAEYAGETLKRGFVDYLDFLAIVSVSLGVLNLLPIPMLDGGQIVYQTVEGATGKPVSERWQIAYQQVGVVLLLGFMSLAFYNDIARIVERVLS
ncbi:MAG: RIP metalloprotease RseP [Pseudomonadota bacterium]